MTGEYGPGACCPSRIEPYNRHIFLVRKGKAAAAIWQFRPVGFRAISSRRVGRSAIKGPYMRLKSVSVANVRSFLTRQTLAVDAGISIIVGPNGGGKTNLFDAITILIRKFLIPSVAIIPEPQPGSPTRRIVQGNNQLDTLTLERHNSGQALGQEIQLEIEITASDVEAMREMYVSKDKLIDHSKDIVGWNYKFLDSWGDQLPEPGSTATILWKDGALTWDTENSTTEKFVRYLQHHETDRLLREEIGEQRLAFPVLYLPTNRAQNGVPNSLELGNFEIYNLKRDSDAISSRHPNSNLPFMALGRLAKIHRTTVDIEGGTREAFDQMYEVQQISRELEILGYGWSLQCTNRIKNTYTILIYKNGEELRLDQISSGEKELLSYVFSIFGLGIRDALILVDEPELHLHPAWQEKLLGMFGRLSAETGNQFLLATHSPRLVTRDSILGVSRVYADGAESRIQRLDASGLPHAKHLLHIVNAENNGKIFFCDRVILVEGIHDELFYNAFIRSLKIGQSARLTEVVRVGGKMLFRPYVDLLSALNIECHVIADFDYLKQVGETEVKKLFTDNPNKIARDVILNGSSVDGKKLVALFTESLSSGKWEGTQELWDHILSTRLGPMIDLNSEQKELVSRDIDRLAKEGVHVLSSGELEDYLPDALNKKDTASLIEFLEDPAFPQRLSSSSRSELETKFGAIFA